MFTVIDFTDLRQVALWASYLIAFYIFGRKSNMVPPSKAAFDPSKHLQRKDILMSDAGLIVVIKWTKSLQLFTKKLTIPLAAVPGSPLCPVSAFKLMVSLIRAKPSAPAFVYPCKKQLVSLTYSDYTNFLMYTLQKVRVNPRAYSAHSFRRGGASWAFRCGVPADLIQSHGTWRSEAYKQYLTFTLDTKLSVTQKWVRPSANYKHLIYHQVK